MIGKKTKYISNLSSIDEESIDLVGVKATIFHKLTKEHVPFQNGFIVNTSAFDDFVVSNNLADEIGSLIEKVDKDKLKKLEKISKQIREIIEEGTIPEEIKNQILSGMKGVSGFTRARLEIIPSPINLNIEKHDLSHQKICYINNDSLLIDSIKKAWASMFTKNAMLYREENEYSGELSIALIVQRMGHSEVSGVTYNYDTSDNNPEVIEVESAYGVIDCSEENTLIKDQYKISEKSMEIVEKTIVTQDKMFVMNHQKSDDNIKEVAVSKPWRKKQKLDDGNIIDIAKISLTIEHVIGEEPFTFSWSKEADKIFITDLNFPKDLEFSDLYEFPKFHEPSIEVIPASEIEDDNDKKEESAEEINDERMDYLVSQEHTPRKERNAQVGKLLLNGQGNNRGFYSGRVKLIHNLNDLTYVDPKTIAVIPEEIDAKYLNLNELEIVGAIYEGKTKLNIPTIGDAYRAASLLHEGEIITMDSDEGAIYVGDFTEELTSKKDTAKLSYSDSKTVKVKEEEYVRTAIDTYIELDQPASFPDDHRNISGLFTKNISILKQLATDFDEKPIIYESSFSDQSEYKNDIKLISQLRHKKNFRNLWVSIDSIKRSEDLAEAKKLISSSKLRRSATFNILANISDPTAILGVEEIVKVDIDGIIINIEELITKMFGKFENKLMKETSYNQSINLVGEIAKKYRKPIWINGDLPESELIKLLNIGVTAFITQPANLRNLRLQIANSEINTLQKKPRKTKLKTK